VVLVLALLEDLDLLRFPEGFKANAAFLLFSQPWVPRLCYY
jgi:hypothetical protein